MHESDPNSLREQKCEDQTSHPMTLGNGHRHDYLRCGDGLWNTGHADPQAPHQCNSPPSHHDRPLRCGASLQEAHQSRSPPMSPGCSLRSSSLQRSTRQFDCRQYRRSNSSRFSELSVLRSTLILSRNLRAQLAPASARRKTAESRYRGGPVSPRGAFALDSSTCQTSPTQNQSPSPLDCRTENATPQPRSSGHLPPVLYLSSSRRTTACWHSTSAHPASLPTPLPLCRTPAAPR
mmetsp:Transcript_75853/g.149989  ORF Transcript_75853/g.149989 Transcript_75853/m.149989 type:complete len:235 (+) Transcript_75853:91-795(+)